MTIKTSNNFDALRLLAASMVIFCHSFSLAGIPANNDDRLLVLCFRLGAVAVSIFFVISGYLVTQSFYNSNGIFHFLWKRFLRIYPALFIAVIVTTLAGAFVTNIPIQEYYHHPDTWRYLLNFLIPLDVHNHLPGVFAGNPGTDVINAPFWTIRAELLLYLSIVLIGLLGMVNERGMIYISLLAFAGYMLSLNGGEPLPRFIPPQMGNNYDFGYALRSILFFYLGSLFYLRGMKKGEANLLITLVIALVIALLLSKQNTFGEFLVMLIPFIVINAAFIAPGNPFSRVAKYGDFSYGLYIYGFPVQQTLIHFLQGKIHLWQYIILSFAVTFIFAFLSWHLIEKHALKLKRKVVT